MRNAGNQETFALGQIHETFEINFSLSPHLQQKERKNTGNLIFFFLPEISLTVY